MSRPIKFRAYYIPEKTWVTWDEWPAVCSDYDHPFESTADWKVTQYTGLKDRNGVEIYEGDIVSAGTSSSGDGGTLIRSEPVEYVRGIFEPIAYVTDEVLEVIGNIYENPKLLEASHERSRA